LVRTTVDFRSPFRDGAGHDFMLGEQAAEIIYRNIWLSVAAIVEPSSGNRPAHDPFESLVRLAREIQGGGREILAQMCKRRGSRNEEHVGSAQKEPGERGLQGVAASCWATAFKIPDCSGVNPPSGKNGT